MCMFIHKVRSRSVGVWFNLTAGLVFDAEECPLKLGFIMFYGWGCSLGCPPNFVVVVCQLMDDSN